MLRGGSAGARRRQPCRIPFPAATRCRSPREQSPRPGINPVFDPARSRPRLRNLSSHALRNPPTPRRPRGRSHHRLPRRAHPPDHRLPVQGLGPRRPPLCPPGIWQHLHASDEPDQRRVRETRRRARRRRRRPSHLLGALRPVPRDQQHHHRRRQLRHHFPPLRRLLQSVQKRLQKHRRRGALCRRRQRRQLRAPHRRPHQGHLPRNHRQPRPHRARLRRLRRPRAETRSAAHRGQHLRRRWRDLPTAQTRRPRPRGIRHQVDRRQRHQHGRRHRRCRHLQLGQRQVSPVHLPLPKLPRHGAQRGLWPRRSFRQHSVHHPLPHRGPARLGVRPRARSTRSCSCKAWKPSRSASSAPAKTPSASPAGSSRSPRSPP